MINLRTARVKKGLTQRQLADMIEVRRQTLSNIEVGVARPSIPTANKLGEVLELDWADFFKE